MLRRRSYLQTTSSKPLANASGAKRPRRPLAAMCLGLVGCVVLLQNSSSEGNVTGAADSFTNRAFLGLLRLSSHVPSARRLLRASSSSSVDLPSSYFASVRPYSTPSVINTQRQFQGRNRDLLSLLVFDGATGTFRIYIDGNRRAKPRVQVPSYLLVDVLRTHRPGRFERGQPNMQILFSGDDYIGLQCDDDGMAVIKEEEEGTDESASCSAGTEFAPVLSFGSVPKASSEMIGDVIQAFPIPPYLPCIAEYHNSYYSGRTKMGQKCHVLPELPPVDENHWDDLKPQVFWRGSDWPFYLPHYFPFPSSATGVVTEEEQAQMRTAQDATAALRRHWDELQPRWKAVTMSVEGDVAAAAEAEAADSWIDVKFVTKPDKISVYQPFLEAGAEVVTTQRADDAEHAQYRYHIDLGGGSGTTWRGAISKLLMPGLLFHHETYTKDFFYDEMKPYEHYVPVQQDLSDLKEKYDWAEANIEKAQAIAKAGTDLALRLGSDRYIRELYDGLFVEQLGKIVDSYQAQETETIESILAAYEGSGLAMKEYGECDLIECRWQGDSEDVVKNLYATPAPSTAVTEVVDAKASRIA